LRAGHDYLYRMTDSLRTRLSAIEPAMLRGIARGLEKESLRATADGNLAMRLARPPLSDRPESCGP